MDNTLTIVIVARNEEGNLSRLLNSIERVCPADRVQTCLVDHMSTDRTAGVAREAGVGQVFPMDGGTIAEARNRGGFAVETDWIAFIDADCELSKKWWEMVSSHLKQPGIYGWPVSPPHPPTWVQAAWHTHWTNKVAGLRCATPRQARGEVEEPAISVEPTTKNKEPRTKNQEGSAFRLITTANLILHKDVFQTLGGFDPELASGEDQNLMLRAMQQGFHIQAIPGLDVIHHGEPATLRDFYRQQLWHANRASYTRILKASALRTQGNAPLFTVLYVAGLSLAILGFVLYFFVSPWTLLAIVPWCALIAFPALRTSLRAKKMRHWMPLCVLYAAYGLARSLDLVGLNPVKRSWR